jgi:NADH-quinone oxidoreductase subunit L
MFHLSTHAFFKALLFLGAGSVIHAIHEQDIFKMGGLSKKMPITTWTFIIGAMALSGIFPLAGFWSKDEILFSTMNGNFTILYILGLTVAFITPYYMFRLIFVAFFRNNNGAEDSHAKHIHESPLVMTIPLVVLAIFSVFAGFVNSPLFYKMFGQSFGTFVFFGAGEAPHLETKVALISSAASLAGIFIAWLIYSRNLINTDKAALRLGFIYKLIYNKFYIDNLYSLIFKKIFILAGTILNWSDHKVIDGTFDGFGNTLRISGTKLRKTQTGLLQNYAMVIFTAVVIIVIAVYILMPQGVVR